MGILNPVVMAQQEYERSREASERLTNMIFEQEQDLSRFDREKMREKVSELTLRKEKVFKEEHDRLEGMQDQKTQRLILASQEK